MSKEEIILDNKENYLKTLAFARIIGLLITDGHINRDDNRGSIFLGHKLDVECFLVDLNMFCDKESYIIQKNCYTINLPNEFMKNILITFHSLEKPPTTKKHSRLNTSH